MANRSGNNGNCDRLYFTGLQNHCSHEIKRHLLRGRKAMTNLDSILKSTILWSSVFFRVQFSHPYMTIALTIRTFISKVMSLLFNMLSRFVIAFLPRSTHLLISWLQSPSAVILEPKKIKSDTVYSFSPSICHKK